MNNSVVNRSNLKSKTEASVSKLREQLADEQQRGLALLADVKDYQAANVELRYQLARAVAALREIRKGQQPMDYALPLTTIRRLVDTANEALAEIEAAK